MEIIAETPFQVGWLVWQVRPPTPSMTIAVKATYVIQPDGACAIDPKQAQVTGELFYEDDETHGVRYDTDLAILKKRGECFLAGSCRPAARRAVSAATVGFQVGKVNKSFSVFGDRYWKPGVIGKATDPVPFTDMPLRWERSFGGPTVPQNPLGSGIIEIETPEGPMIRLPNIEDPQKLIAVRDARPNPVGAFPIPRTWPSRTKRTGTYDAAWVKQRWPWFPDDFDWAYFNSAPEDQQIDGFWRGDEEIVLQNLDPLYPRLKTRLPGLRSRCFLETRRPNGPDFSEVRLQLDTITVDTDQQRVYCVWRGLVEVASEKLTEVTRMFLMHEPLADNRSVAECRARFQALALKANAEDQAFLPEEPPQETATEVPDVEEPETPAEIAEEQKLMADFEKAVNASSNPREGKEVAPPSMDQLRAMAAAAGMDFPDELFAIPEEPADEADEPATDEPVSDARAEVIARFARGESMAGADYTGANLTGLELRGADFSKAILDGVNFIGAHLDGANFDGAILSNANLSRATLQDASLKAVDLALATVTDADLTGADLTGAMAFRANFARSTLREVTAPTSEWNDADLSNAILAGGVFDEADFSRAKMERVDCTAGSFVDATFESVSAPRIVMDHCELGGLRAGARADFSDGSFLYAKANGSSWTDARLDRANLAFAEFERADFGGASMVKAALGGCILRRARFRDAKLVAAAIVKSDVLEASFESADLSHADLRGSNFHATEFWRARLDNVKFELAILTGTQLET